MSPSERNAKRVILTGATGFVGAGLARRLLQDGHDIHLLVRPGYSPWRIEAIRGDVHLHEMDLGDEQALTAVVGKIQPDWVFHLAAHGAYSSQTDLRQIVQTNITGTINLVEACLKTGFEAFVNTGSSSEYGFKDHAPSERDWLLNTKYILAQRTPLGTSLPVTVSVSPPADLRHSQPLAPEAPVGQVFQASANGLSTLLLSFASRGSPPTGEIHLHLRRSPDSTIDLRTVTLPVSQVQLSGVTRFSFSPLPDSAGQSYFFQLEVSGAGSEPPLALWETIPASLPTVGGAALNALPVKPVLLLGAEYTSPALQDFRLVYNRDIQIYENQHALPRVFVVHRIQTIPENDQAVTQLSKAAFVPLQTLVLAAQPPASQLAELAHTPRSGPSTSRLVSTRLSLSTSRFHLKWECSLCSCLPSYSACG